MKISAEQVKTAAKRLFDKGEITSEELEGIEKDAGILDTLKAIMPTAENLGETLGRNIGSKDIPFGTSAIDKIRLGLLATLGAGLAGGVTAVAKSEPAQNLVSAGFKSVMPKNLVNIAFPSKTGIIDLLGKAAIPTAVGLGLSAAGYKGIDMLRQKSAINNSLEAIKTDPLLADKDQDKVEDYFGVVKDFAPRAAANPLVASALVNKMMQFGGVDHKLVQDLSSIEGDRKEYLADQLTNEAVRTLLRSSLIPGGD
jgi:hypothetical protein